MILDRVNSVIRFFFDYTRLINNRIIVRVIGTVESIILSSSKGFGLGQLESLWPISPYLMHALC